MTNKIICIGTIYPIFTDAAVEFMAAFMRFLLQGICLGEALRKARKELIANRKYSKFDWAPYILLGDPKTQIQFQQEEHRNANLTNASG